MKANDFAGLDLSRYELRLRARRAANLPAFLGSTLRGAFGHALKAAVCVMNHRQCERCMVADRCIYPYLFETPVPADVPQLRGQQQAPHPFILSPPMLQAPEKPQRAKVDSLPERARSSLSPEAGSDSGRHGSQALPERAHTNSPPQPASAHRLADGRMVKLVHAPVAVKSAHSPDEVNAEGRRRLAAGDELRFGLLLMGRAIEYLPYVVYAVSEMARGGLGADRAPFELVEVAMIDEGGARQAIYCGQSQRITVPDSATRSLDDLIRARLDQLAGATGCSAKGEFNADALRPSGNRLKSSGDRLKSSGDRLKSSGDGLKSSGDGLRSSGDGLKLSGDGLSGDGLRLRFLTPARIRVEGDLQVGMSFELLARNLLRRVSMLTAVHGRARLELDYRGLIARAAAVETRTSRLRWWDWERYSNRQQTKMTLGGFIGEVEYAGEALQDFLPLIVAGELLHVGAGTSFGLGRYEIAA